MPSQTHTLLVFPPFCHLSFRFQHQKKKKSQTLISESIICAWPTFLLDTIYTLVTCSISLGLFSPIGIISFSVPMCFKITPTKNTPYRLFWKWVKNTVRKNFHSFFQRHLFSLELFMEVVVCFFK